MTRAHRLTASLTTFTLLLLPAAAGARAAGARPAGGLVLRLERGAREPARRGLEPEALDALRAAVRAAPRDRAARFALAKALADAGRPEEALREARAWRQRDAYNLVVVRMIGDLYAELGRRAEARRAYSAVVELLAEDAEAHRALATVLRQGGDLEGAYDRLAVAARLRPEDTRIAFELADTAQRLERGAEAIRRFEAIVLGATTPDEVRYPAKQRLVQLYARARRTALARGEAREAARLMGAIDALQVKGGVTNAIKIYLSWDTDRTDVDLWVTNPRGEKIYYERKKGSCGGALYHDVTGGYGPESFTAPEAIAGRYKVEVSFYGTSRRSFSEARGEVVVILNEGSAAEERHVLPYRLFQPKQTVTVATIAVERSK